jgi:hypothetical protein
MNTEMQLQIEQDILDALVIEGGRISSSRLRQALSYKGWKGLGDSHEVADSSEKLGFKVERDYRKGTREILRTFVTL